MRRSLQAAAAAAVAALPSVAHAACDPNDFSNTSVAGYYAFVRLNQQVFNFSCLIQAAGSGYSVQGGTAGNTSVSLTASYATGATPGLNYTVGLNNSTASTNDVAFLFIAPLTHSIYTEPSSTIDYGVASQARPGISIASIGSGAAILSPTPGAVTQSNVPAYLVGTRTPVVVQTGNNFLVNLGVDLDPSGASCSIATLASNVPNPGVRKNDCHASFDMGSGVGGGYYTLDSYAVSVSYRQNGGANTSSSATGAFALSAVPEPSTVTLMASGMLTLVGVGYSRRRRA